LAGAPLAKQACAQTPAAGSAVGLGNIWRFPYLAGQNGGAAFLLIYLICVFMLCFPVMIGEIAIGRKVQSDAYGSYQKLGGAKWGYLGLFGILAGVFILSFYNVVAGWAFGYFLEISFGSLLEEKDFGAFFGSYINDVWTILTFSLGFMVLTALIVSQGIQKGVEAANKIKALQKAGAEKLILDLRNTAECDPAEGVALANLFLDHGTITYLQGQKYPKETFNADPKNTITKLPMTVLVNRGTANAAEITAAAILENQRGDVLGDKTFGVGSVQKVIEVPDGSALILSIAKYYSPSGKAIQDSAVTPNILVADADDDAILTDDDEAPPSATDEKKPAKQPEDEQLKRAVESLKNRG